MDFGKPAHAEILLRDLEAASDVHAALLRYVSLLPADCTLMNAYLQLTFSPELRDFLTTPSRSQALATIAKEYEVRPGSRLEVDAELRDSLARTYHDLGLATLATLPGLELPSQYLLTDMWGHASPSSEGTPKSALLRSASTRGSQFATPSSWVSESEEGLRGLKRLSAMVKSVVCSKTSIPHKEVVARVLSEVSRTVGGMKDKEERNIKRRLYDAINVLIAVGVIAKEGRCLAWKGDYLFCSDGENVVEKEVQLRGLVGKYLAVKWLLQRNSVARQPREMPFPFILLATPDTPDNSISICANSEVTRLRLSFAQQIKTLGDLEVLTLLSAEAIDLRTALALLPHHDLLKYASVD